MIPTSYAMMYIYPSPLNIPDKFRMHESKTTEITIDYFEPFLILSKQYHDFYETKPPDASRKYCTTVCINIHVYTSIYVLFLYHGVDKLIFYVMFLYV